MMLSKAQRLLLGMFLVMLVLVVLMAVGGHEDMMEEYTLHPYLGQALRSAPMGLPEHLLLIVGVWLVMLCMVLVFLRVADTTVSQ